MRKESDRPKFKSQLPHVITTQPLSLNFVTCRREERDSGRLHEQKGRGHRTPLEKMPQGEAEQRRGRMGDQKTECLLQIPARPV